MLWKPLIADIDFSETLVGRHQGGADYGGLYQHCKYLFLFSISM